MTTYSDSIWRRICALLGYALTIAIVYVLIAALLSRYVYLYAIPALIALYGVYDTILRKRLRVHLDADTLRVMRGQTLKHCFVRSEASFSYYSKTTTDNTIIFSEHDYRLYVHYEDEEEPLLVDLSEMSYTTFHQLLIDLDIYDPEQSIRVHTTTKPY